MEIAVLDYSGCTNTLYKVTKKELKNVLKEHDLSEDEDIDATVRLWLEKQNRNQKRAGV